MTTTDPAARMRDRAGQADPSRLPHSCRCGARWSGTSTAHCAGDCHKTYSGVTAFDANRRDGKCRDPRSVAMSPLQNRAYECWGYPAETTEA